MEKCDYMFSPGRLTVVIDGQFGSTGKGKLVSYLNENASIDFACCAHSTQAGHTVILDDRRQFFYQQLPSLAYSHRVGKLYIGPGAVIDPEALLNEITINEIMPERLGISPLAMLLDPMDALYERGIAGFGTTTKMPVTKGQ